MSLKITPLLDICENRTSAISEFAGERQYLTTGNLDYDKVVKADTVTYNNRPSRANRKLKLGDVIFARMQDTVKVLQINNETLSNMIVSTGFVVLHPKEGLLPSYLKYFLLSGEFNIRKNSLCNGATQRAINDTNLRKIKILLPPLAEQKRIINILEKADTLRKKRREVNGLSNKIIQSIFLEMFGDPAHNPKKWKIYSLGEYIATLTDYHANGSYKILRKHVRMTDKQEYAIMVRSTDLENNNFEADNKYITKGAYDFLTKTKLFGGEILVNKIGSAGKVYFMPTLSRPASLGMNLFLLRFNEMLNNLYVYHYLTSLYGQLILKRKAHGAVTKTITKKEIRSIPIALPPVRSQQRFANVVQKVTKIKDKQKQSEKEIENLFQGLMAKFFNGA